MTDFEFKTAKGEMQSLVRDHIQRIDKLEKDNAELRRQSKAYYDEAMELKAVCADIEDWQAKGEQLIASGPPMFNLGVWWSNRPWLNPVMDVRSENKVTFFKAFMLVVFLAVANFGWQFFQGDPNFTEATERTYFQAWSLLLAWAFWRDPGEKTDRRGQGRGFCD